MTADPARPPRPATVQARGGPLGLVEWFHPGEHARVEWSLERLRALGISRLRTHISWAEYVAEGGADWYDWLLPRLAGEVELLPCVHFTPPSLSRTGRANGPPLVLKDYAEFVDHLITRYDGRFDAVEIWNEPNNQLDWDWQQDQDWLLFCEMAGNAAHWIRARGLKALLGGPSPVDLNWLRLMGERGLFGSLDAVGLHGFPGTWDSEARSWRGWDALIAAVRDTVHAFNPRLELWITEAGYSTWRRDPFAQLGHFIDVLDLPVERVYWYGLQDVGSNVAVQEGLHFDERQYHFGLHDEQRQPKLLGRLLASGGVPAVRAVLDAGLPRPALAGTRPTLVTGGAGFIGSNLADRLARNGEDVLVLDSLARPGVEENLHWLRRRHRGRLSVAIADLRDEGAVADAAHDASSVVPPSLARSPSPPRWSIRCATSRSTYAAPSTCWRRSGAAPPGPAPSRCRWCSPPPTRSMATSPTSGCRTTRTPTCRSIPPCARTASAKDARSRSIPPRAAPRGRPTSTCWTTPARSTCRPWCCA